MELTDMVILLLLPLLVVLFLLLLPVCLLFNALSNLIRQLRREDLKNKVVLITGASSGIGEQLAYEYAKKGALLVLVARREESLARVAEKARSLGSPDVVVVPADVSKADDCQRAVDRAVLHFGKLDHLVANAGLGCYCPFEEAGKIREFTKIMDINFWGSVYATHFAVPHLRRSRGRVVAVASVAGRVPLPGSSFYNASKAAMIMFYETLRAEVGSAVKITIVNPGWIKSEITEGKGMLRGGDEGVDRAAKDATVGLFPIASTKGCAKAIVEGACKGQRYVTWPSWYRLMYLIITFVPSELMDLHYRKAFTANVSS